MGKRDLSLVTCLAAIGILLAILVNGVSDRSAKSETNQTAGIGAAPRRIAIAAPSVCEIVFHLGCGEHVVGVSDFCTYPPEALTKEKIGGWLDPNRERIIALRPDLMMTQGKHESVATLCAERGIEFFTLEIDSLADIRAAMLAAGERLGAHKRADEAVRAWDATLEEIREREAGRPRPVVFLTFSRPPGKLTGLMTPGPGTFLADLIEVAGGENVFDDARTKWPTISKETLVVRKPDVILELFPEGLDDGKRKKLRADWQSLPNLPAAKNGRIHYLTGSHLLLPGPRALKTAEAMVRILHPEAFDE